MQYRYCGVYITPVLFYECGYTRTIGILIITMDAKQHDNNEVLTVTSVSIPVKAVTALTATLITTISVNTDLFTHICAFFTFIRV